MSLPLLPLLLGGIVSDVVEGVTDAIFGVATDIAEAIASPIADSLADPLYETMVATPKPKRCTRGAGGNCAQHEPALVREPTNGMWPEVWDIYWGEFIGVALIVGLVLYAMGNFVGTIPFVSPEFRERFRGGYLKMLVALPLAWPILTTSLYLMGGMIQIVAPDLARFEVFVTGVISGMIVQSGGALAMVSVFLAVWILLLYIGAIMIFLLRAVYLVSIFAIAPLLVMAYSLNIPMGRSIAEKLLGTWVKFGIAPLFVAFIYRITTLMFTRPDGAGGYQVEYAPFGQLGIGGGQSAAANAMLYVPLALLLPILGIWGTWVIVTAQLPSQINRGVRKVKRTGVRAGKAAATGGAGAAGAAAGGAATRNTQLNMVNLMGRKSTGSAASAAGSGKPPLPASRTPTKDFDPAQAAQGAQGKSTDTGAGGSNSPVENHRVSVGYDFQDLDENPFQPSDTGDTGQSTDHVVDLEDEEYGTLNSELVKNSK